MAIGLSLPPTPDEPKNRAPVFRPRGRDARPLYVVVFLNRLLGCGIFLLGCVLCLVQIQDPLLSKLGQKPLHPILQKERHERLGSWYYEIFSMKEWHERLGSWY